MAALDLHPPAMGAVVFGIDTVDVVKTGSTGHTGRLARDERSTYFRRFQSPACNRLLISNA